MTSLKDCVYYHAPSRHCLRPRIINRFDEPAIICKSDGRPIRCQLKEQEADR